MSRNYRLFASTALLWGSCYSPFLLAHDEPTNYSDQEAFEEIVSFVDLDLSNSNGQKVLRSRVQSAAKKLCKRVQVLTLPLYGDMQERQCIAKTALGAEPQIALAINNANREPTLAVSAGSIVLATPLVR